MAGWRGSRRDSPSGPSIGYNRLTDISGPYHRFDRLVVADINLDPQSGAACGLDLGDRAVGGHILRLGLEFLIRAQVQIGDRDSCAQPGEPLRICPSEATRST